MTDSSYAKSIELPTDQIFKHLKDAKRFAIDIGKDKPFNTQNHTVFWWNLVV